MRHTGHLSVLLVLRKQSGYFDVRLIDFQIKIDPKIDFPKPNGGFCCMQNDLS